MGAAPMEPPGPSVVFNVPQGEVCVLGNKAQQGWAGGVERVRDDEGDASVCTTSLCVKGSPSVIIVINCLLTRHQAWPLASRHNQPPEHLLWARAMLN